MLEVDLGMMAVFYALRWFSKLRTSKVGVSVVVTILSEIFVLQKVVCLWLFTGNPSGFLWRSLKNCEISRQMLV